MADMVSKETRSRMMSGIKGKNTKPEMMIRRALHARGFRYVLHDMRLPGKPDLVFPKYKAVIFVHGCFWHGHDCHLFKWPKSNVEFWREKIGRNRAIDESTTSETLEAGWRSCIVWECALKGREKLQIDDTIKIIVKWLNSAQRLTSIRGTNVTEGS